MTDRQSPSTMRELRAHLGQPGTLVALAAVALVLAVTGAFGTDARFGLLARFGYWLVIVGATYAFGYATDRSLSRRIGQRGEPGQIAAIAFVTALGVTGLVLAANMLILGLRLEQNGLFSDVLTILILAFVVSAAIQIVWTASARNTAQDTPAAPALLDRLPLDKRGALVALSVEDHYVRVRTSAGEEMLLMRLSDAIRETAPTPGLQVHRSHWVATDAVTKARRDGDRAILTLSHGGDIPASRSHIKALKEAGLLPR